MRIPTAMLALALVLGALLPSASAQAQQVEITEEARKQFSVGVELLEDPSGPRFREAYEAFRRAYQASPSPKILSNLGLCAMKLERDKEAIDAYERYLAEVSDIDPAERQRIQTDLQLLRSRTAFVTLRTEPEKVQIVDRRTPESGEPIVNRYESSGPTIELGLHAGKHVLEITADAYETARVEIDVIGGQRVEREVSLEPAPTPAPEPGELPPPAPAPAPSPEPIEEVGGSGLPLTLVIGGAVTGAALVGMAITGGLALKAKSDYRGFEDGGDRSDAEKVRKRGQTLNIVTDVLLGVTIAAGATTLVLFLVGVDGKDTAGLEVAPLVGAAPGGDAVAGALLTGRF